MNAKERREQLEKDRVWREGLTTEQRQAIKDRKEKWQLVRSHFSAGLDLAAKADMGCRPSEHFTQCTQCGVSDMRRSNLRKGALSHLYKVGKLLAELGYGIESPQNAPGHETDELGDTSADA